MARVCSAIYSLVRIGARPGFFGRVVEAGYHQRAIRMVHAGAVDAAAIDSQVLAVERLRRHSAPLTRFSTLVLYPGNRNGP
jgi:hypothetical protein